MSGHWISAHRVIREAKPALSRIERHTHEFFHFVYCMDGSVTSVVNGDRIVLEKDDTLLVSPHTVHSFYIPDHVVTIEAKFHCDPELERELTREPYRLSRGNRVAAQVMREIIDEALKQVIYYEDIINAKLLSLMFFLLRRDCGPEATAPEDFQCRYLAFSGRDPWLNSIVNYIEDNLRDELTVRSIANHFGYESSYFSVLFKEHTSYALSQYIAERKIDLAKEMLMEGRSVTDVAKELSFSSVHHFSKKFKNMVGVSPVQFTERVRVQLAVNVDGDHNFPPTGEFEYHTKEWDGKTYN